MTNSGLGRLQGRRILVVGACGYVGRAIADECESDGALVFRADCAQGENAPSDSFHFVDLRNPRDCRVLLDTTLKTLGGLDVLIHAAGVMHPDDCEPTKLTEDAWNQTVDSNAKSAWLIASECASVFIAQRSGAIVTIGSVVAFRGSKHAQLAYAASKGALSALTRELAAYLAPFGVRANSVCPGILDGGVMAPRLKPEADRVARVSRVPLGRLGVATDVAKACVFLASDDANYITGVELPVDGGVSSVMS